MFKENKFIRSVINIILLILILVLINTFLTMYLPYLLSKFIDNFYNGYIKYKYIYQFLIFSIFLFVFSAFQKYLIESLSWKFTNHLRIKLLTKIMQQDSDFFIKHSYNDLLEYFEVDILKIYNFLTKSLPNFCNNIFVIIFVVAFFGYESRYIFLFFLAYIFLNFLFVKFYRKTNRDKVIEESNYHEYMSGRYGEWLALKNLPAILGVDKYIIDKFENLQNEWLKYRIDVNKYYYAIWCITLLLNAFVDIFILGISGMLFFYKKVSIGDIYLYYSYGKKIKNPMESLQQQLQYFEKLFASIKRINKLIDENFENLKTKEDKFKIDKIKNIKVENLEFNYNEKKVLNNLSIELAEASAIGIYGKSGDGKSTFLKLLAKIINSNENSIFINGIDICNIDVGTYNEKIIYLQNETIVFRDSLFNNITMFDKKISLEEVDHFLQNENLYKYIENRKLTDFVSDEEMSISQKQVISIMRLFFVKKDLIVLDETFSHIESDIAVDLIEKIKRINKNSIIICISHNLDKLKSFKKLYEIEKGRIYEKK